MNESIDVIVRTKNSEEFLKECLQAIFNEIPVRKVIIVDGGSIDRTLEIASSFERVDLYVEPKLNLGQATKFGFSKAETPWVAVIDSDVILKKGWFYDMKNYMKDADAVEGGEIGHYRLDIRIDPRKLRYVRLGHVLIRREPVLDMDLDLPFGEDNAISYNFKKLGLKWKKVENDLADHYPKIEGAIYRRTGEILKLDRIHIPKEIQIDQGHIARKYNFITSKEAIDRVTLLPIYDFVRSFKKNFWFCLAYFKII